MRPGDGRQQLDEISAKIRIIAIIEDDEPLREAFESILRAAGYSVDTFPSAEAFLDFPDKQTAKCLVLDVRLPGMSGIELQRRLLLMDLKAPIVFVTAHGDASMREVVMNAGASAFLTKPVRSETLLESIRRAVERKA